MLDWHEAFAAGIPVVGGKGWNLARLHRYGFEVPAGGVLPASRYQEACRVPEVASAVAALRGVPPERAGDPDVAAALERVQAALRAVPVDVAVPGPVAVRSSAVAEDGAEASFAGIHESFLDVTDVPAAVRECWASLWTPRALAYRRRLGLSDDAVACAVVICAMVPAVSAGVAFTCDPISGRRDLVVVDAGRGLGDRLVRGQVTPHRVVLRRVRGRFRVEESQGEPVLDDEQALRLARLAWRVHWALGDGQDPQDLEWAWDGARFHLLQARPVTRVPHHTFPGVRDVPVWWSNANMKDAVPGVVSTLAWSFIQEAIPDVLYALPHAVGYEVPPGMPITRRFDGHAYFDFTGMQWGFYDSLGMTPEETVRAIGGHQPAIPVPPGNPVTWRRFRARLAMLKRLWQLPGRLRAGIDRHMRECRAFPADLGGWALRDLRLAQERLNALHDRLDPLVGLANVATGGWHEGLEALLRSVGALHLESRLLTGSGSIVSAEQGYRIFDLAQAARRDEAEFQRELARYLEDYGHRAVYEADSMNPRWAEDPSYILEQVRAAMDMEESPRERARRVREQAEAELWRRAGWRAPLLRFLLSRVREGMALREAAKSAMCATLLPARRIALEVGRRLSALDEPAQVFHLSRPDLEAVLEEEWDGRGACALARDRAAQREVWLQCHPPDVLRQDATPWRVAEAVPAEGALAGLGVASGVVEGVARVLRHPHEGGRLARGEILVAPSTDPGWTPLFLKAGGIVMESGGYLSHGAIVAREFGIPGVTNVAGVLSRVQDGQRLRVDGDRGTVEVLGAG